MPLQKINAGTHDDGRPKHHFIHDNDPGEAVVYVGPHIGGHVTMPDGTVYDVTEHVIAVRKGHEGLVSHAIGMRHEAEGHPLHRDGEPYVHLCTADHCGEQARHIDDAISAYEARANTDLPDHADKVAHHRRQHAHVNGSGG